jgi:hypothetical protein
MPEAPPVTTATRLIGAPPDPLDDEVMVTLIAENVIAAAA